MTEHVEHGTLVILFDVSAYDTMPLLSNNMFIDLQAFDMLAHIVLGLSYSERRRLSL